MPLVNQPNLIDQLTLAYLTITNTPWRRNGFGYFHEHLEKMKALEKRGSLP